MKLMNIIPTVYANTGTLDIKKDYSLGFLVSIGAAVKPLIGPIFAVAGTIVFIYFIVGAFRMIISQGDKNIIHSAREEMVHGIVGFILLIFLFLVAEYLPKFLGFSNFNIVGP